MMYSLTYDDIQLVPGYSTIKSRFNIKLNTQVSRRYGLLTPLVASPMDTICEFDMAYKMAQMGGVGCIHRFMSIEEQSEQVRELKEKIYDEKINEKWENNDEWETEFRTVPIMAAIGVQDEDKERAKSLVKNGANVLLIDVAHGHHINVINMIKWCKKNLENHVDIIAGNIVTKESAIDLENAGADGLRVGIGGGCFTPHMKVKTNLGLKNIEDVNVNDVVYTHTGKEQKVLDVFTFEKDEELFVINDIECTENHEFYVINKNHQNVTNKDNYQDYAEWVTANNLTENHLLIDILDEFKLKTINNITTKHYKGKVYDLSVDNDFSYNINGIIVHNSLCTTRIQTGFGVPNVTALENVISVAKTPVMADGGIRYSGDIAKALSLGASNVMLGSLLSGTEETPGKIIETPNGLYKRYRGSASLETKITHNKETRNVEGESTVVPFKGGVKFILKGLIDGLKSALSYHGSNKLIDFRPKYVVVTNAGLQESKPHLIK